ncbi:low temperature requirement protein A [Gordonia sp. HY285]|uniref:low temperature requirement protein A n=1 Tax=Gordonia liuliyuniae TaxID=2911517 RepID=UPI001F1C9EBE|nr:low temperature requirement protein A [Gordonia liuliyuniae]MCF8609573.1 low temperature requirement protein A [Gordonia liuliyuniae]
MRTQLQRMIGRDPDEGERAGSGLEVFYDLIFVVLFSVAGVQLADYLAEGEVFVAVVGYLLVAFAAIWAWINFAWFASAFDTDDPWFRLSVLVQMIGVSIMAVGIPPVFSSIHADAHVDVKVIVFGYMVMRLGLVPQWLRAAYQSVRYRQTCLTYAVACIVAQIGWTIVALAPMGLRMTLVAILICVVIEFLGPFVAEKRKATPWNPFHITERFSTLIVITLGEGVVGTVAVLQAQIGRGGWTAQTAVLGATALGVTFSMWWLYAAMPNGKGLAEHRSRCFLWGYGMIPVFMACAAVGAGMDLIAKWIEGETHDSSLMVMAAVAIPLAVFTIGVIVAHYYLIGPSGMELMLIVTALIPIIVGLVLVAVGVPLLVAVVVGALAPVLPVLIIEFSERFEPATL